VAGNDRRPGQGSRSFEKQPDDRLGLQAIAEITGSRLAQMYELRRSGGLPPEDGRRGASPWWFRSTIDAWLAGES
jgi:predicted DNA-binding transcriptional regulator AlpA